MDRSLDSAVDTLTRGGLVVYPTDTLFGLAAAATKASAVRRLLRIKLRPTTAPVAVAFSSLEEFEPYAELSVAARGWLRQHLPGPWTVLARTTPRARRNFPDALLGRDGSIGIRIPDHPVARELARRIGPITCTSANRTGDPPCRTLAEARRIFGSQVEGYVDGGNRPSGRPSTVVDLRRPSPTFRRRG